MRSTTVFVTMTTTIKPMTPPTTDTMMVVTVLSTTFTGETRERADGREEWDGERKRGFYKNSTQLFPYNESQAYLLGEYEEFI